MKGLTRLGRNFVRPGAAWVFVIVTAFAIARWRTNPQSSPSRTLPTPTPGATHFNAVAATSTSDAWAVGYRNDNNLNGSRTLTQHWDGSCLEQRSAARIPAVRPTAQTNNTGNVLTARGRNIPQRCLGSGILFLLHYFAQAHGHALERSELDRRMRPAQAQHQR